MIAHDFDHTRRFLSAVMPADGCLEVRIFNATIDRGNFVVGAQQYAKTLAGWYDRPDALLADLGRIRGVSAYITHNPINSALLARADNHLLAKAKHTSNDSDVTALRWLYIDVDATRPADISSTDAELVAALARRDSILAAHPELAASALWGCSGNGGWILVRLPDYPNDDAHKGIVARALGALATLYTDPAVKVDPATKNPSRVMCLPGTVKAKGSNRPDRPWRLVTVDGGADDPPPFDLSGWVAQHASTTAPPSPSARRRPAPLATHAGAAPQAPQTRDEASIVQRAAAYLANLDPAISGEGGHDQTFDAACALVKGFDLSIGDARPILTAWNATCQPPWSPTELEHKLSDAEAKPDDKPRGYLLEANGSTGKNGQPYNLAAAFGAALATQGGEAHGADSPVVPIPAAVIAAIPTDPGELCAPGSEANPHRLARLFVDQHYRQRTTDSDGTITLTLRFWREEFLSWDGTCYRPVPSKEIRAELASFLANEFDRLYGLALIDYGMRKTRAAQDGASAGRMPTLIPVTTRLIGDVVQALAGVSLLTVEDCPTQPAWLDHPLHWPVGEMLAARNALVHLPTFADPRDDAYSMLPTPTFFSSNSLDYDFDPSAPSPIEWLRFLDSLWPDDPQSVLLLQEWFGYTLTADTSHQKMLMIIGPKRSGKGTIARINKALVGEANVVAPTLSGLATPFGVAPLIGKTLAIIGDARLGGRTDSQVIVERLLSISGEDAQTIDRKHLSSWNGQLAVRFCLISNELPRLGDSSGALPSRMVLLRLTKSFYGHEDKHLLEKLLVERSSILLWAVEGWRRLRERGRFIQPESASELINDLHDLASPIQAFLDEKCIRAPTEQVAIQTLYTAWRNYCSEKGVSKPGDERTFGKNMRAAIPDLHVKKAREDDKRVNTYVGVGLPVASF